MCRTIGLLIAGLCWLSATAHADAFWSHHDWRVSADNDHCRVATGGDGDDSFVLAFDTGGRNASARYAPVVVRGYPVSIAPDDHVTVLIDGNSWDIDELLAGERIDEWGDPVIDASLPGGLVPDLVAALRGGHQLKLRKVGAPAPNDLATFSLNGFTATLLKAAEWCRFDANKLPSS